MSLTAQDTVDKDGKLHCDWRFDHNPNDTHSDSDCDIAFASIDFTGVKFEDEDDGDKTREQSKLSEIDMLSLSFERRFLILNESPEKGGLESDATGNNFDTKTKEDTRIRIKVLSSFLARGQYADALRGATALSLFGKDVDSAAVDAPNTTVFDTIRQSIEVYCTSVASCVEVEMLGVAALNLFLQLNYTGPSLDKGNDPTEIQEAKPLEGIDPHEKFRSDLFASKYSPSDLVGARGDESQNKAAKQNKAIPSSAADSSTSLASVRDNKYHNAVLSELAVDGELPCHLCVAPYLLLFARSILLTLADPDRKNWSHPAPATVDTNHNNITSENGTGKNGKKHRNSNLFAVAKELAAPQLWSVRAALAHQRLLQSDEPSPTLWNEVRAGFLRCKSFFCEGVELPSASSLPEVKESVQQYEKRTLAASVMLEWGLSQHHFDREGKGKADFNRAMELSGLTVKVTGAEGKRTKFQQQATAQMLVRATSAASPRPNATTAQGAESETGINATNPSEKERIKAQMVKHDDEDILLDRIKFSDEKDNRQSDLTVLDQAILLALCLDVKNTNPKDGLTGEEMGAYLERVLCHHDDWMVYSTALLERAWLECERSHARERAILQIQALADQHTNRLTLTQSTFESVEESAPPQDRLRNLHTIVYPPRWAILRDLAERYAKLGVVTTAAEMFEELELWDEVVECYRHAGKESRAEQIVRDRLSKAETPRMWAALGDLTNDPACFEKSLQLSKGRFSSAYVALGKYYADKGDLKLASDNFKKAVKVKPLTPAVWFRLGTTSMRLGEWETALQAFTEVVQQEPEEGDAWANVAAVHMHNKNPAEAYPALVESLKQNRNNWRVWVSKLYVCIDLQKYDEAVQATHQLLDFKSRKNASEAVPELEEKCVRAVVGGALGTYEAARASEDSAASDSAKRTLARVDELLKRISSTAKTEAWVFETCAYFNDRVGRGDRALEDLMKEHRALQAVGGWETDAAQLKKVCQVALQITEINRSEGSKESLVKCKFMLNGIVKKVRVAYFDDSALPEELHQIESTLVDINKMIVEAKT